MRIGIVISSAASVSATHTTVHLAYAALVAGHVVRVFEPWDFEIDAGGRLRGRAHVLDEAPASRDALVASLCGRTAVRRNVEIDRLDVLLLRVNPLDNAVLTFGQLAASVGVRVLNAPDALVRTSHKAWLATLPGVPRPRTLVTRSRAAVDRFASECGAGLVVKPARSCGGRAVSIVRARRRAQVDAAFDAASRAGDGYLVVQEYLAEASLGEKRLLWLDGALVGGYLRQRAPGELRHNLKNGATPEPCELSAADHTLADALTPHLARAGVWFAGVDVIGGRVVEINTLNPGGVHWSEHFAGTAIARRVVASLESRARPASPLPPSQVATSP